MDCSMPGLPVHHQLLEFTQIHAHWVSDAIQPISSSVIPFSCLQSFPASGSFQMSQSFKSGGQSIGVSASTSVLPVNIQDWFPLGWTGWISFFSCCCCCCCYVASVMSDSVWPHRRQPTRLPRPWDSPGKNTGVGCHFLLQRMNVKSESEVVQSCPTLSDPMDCSLPGSSVYEIFQARVLEWVAIAFSDLLVQSPPFPQES